MIKVLNILKYILLAIGWLGVIVSGYNTIIDGSFSGNFVGFISGGIFIYCFFSLDNFKKTIGQ